MKRGEKSALVELRGVRVTLGGRLALRGVTWTVRRGEGWLVTGANGAGKTTLLRVLAGRIWPDPGTRGGERIYHFGRRASASPIGLEGHLAWLSPETHQRFARLESPPTAGDVILTGFVNTFLLTHRPTAIQRASARHLAKNLGVANLWKKSFIELSQGQQRLVLLARALTPRPKLLVFDEFSDGLDKIARKKIGAIIVQRLRTGSAVVVAAHRASDVLPGLTRHLTLKNGQVTETFLPGRRVGTPLRGVRLQHSHKGQAKISQAESLIYFQNATVAIGDHVRVRRILHHITWSVASGEHWAVLGANGSGKSTFLRAIYGDLPVARGGALKRFGADEVALPLPAARQRMGWVSPALQHHYTADVSVAEVVASGFQSTIGLLRTPTRAELTHARATLRSLGVGKLAPRRWGQLSFGEARLTLLARALVHRPQLLLLDEPCDGLSPTARARFLRTVERAARAGAQVIIAAHRVEDLPACVNRTLHLDNGRII